MKCPFTGMPCPNPPVVHVTDIIDGSPETTHMCCGCGGDFLSQVENSVSKPKFKNKKPKPVLVDIITTVEQLYDILSGKSVVLNEPVRSKKDPCPQCGLTSKDFRRTGRFGCQYCYTHYQYEFESLAGPMHGSDPDDILCHVGKQPKNYRPTEAAQLDRLKLKLSNAIKKEQYEEARTIKKFIDELTNHKN